MRHYIITAIFFLSFSVAGWAQAGKFTPADSVRFENNAFTPGERLNYKVKYGLIPGGYASLSVGMEQIGYDWYYTVKAIAKTSGLVGALANVSDRYESYFDIATGLPIRAVRDIHENNYRKFNEILFRRSDNTVFSLNSGQHKVPPGTLDILSAFYFARRYIFTHELEKNEVINLTTFFAEELFIVKIRYKETEKVRTNFGKVNCLRFVPVLDKNSPFEKEKDMQVWFSDDGNFIPVKIRMKIGISTIKCDLQNYSGLKNTFGGEFKRSE